MWTCPRVARLIRDEFGIAIKAYARERNDPRLGPYLGDQFNEAFGVGRVDVAQLLLSLRAGRPWFATLTAR